MNPRTVLVVLLALVVAFFLHREEERGTFRAFDESHISFLLANRNEKPPRENANVIFVRIDDLDKTERQFESWPLSARDWAVVLEKLAEAQPHGVAVQPVLGWGQEPDADLQAVVAGKANFTFALRGEVHREVAPAEAAAGEFPNLPAFQRVSGEVSLLPTCNVVPNQVELLSLPSLGFSQVDLADHPDGQLVVQPELASAPLLFRWRDKVVPSLLLQALLKSLDLAPDKVEVRLGEHLVLDGKWHIPIDPRGKFTFHLHSSNLRSVPSTNLDHFLLDRELLEKFLKPDDPLRQLLPEFPRSVLWIGLDDKASRRFALPDGSVVSNAELHARILAAIQTGRNVRPVPAYWQAQAIGIVLLLGLWQISLPRAGVWKSGVFILVLVFAAPLLIFQATGMWLPLLPMVGVLAVTTLLGMLIPRVAKPAAPAQP